jgi:hypothetical protein
MRAWVTYLGTVGKPLVVGLAIVATASGLFIYFLTSALWVLKTRWTRNRRLRERLSRNAVKPLQGADDTTGA